MNKLEPLRKFNLELMEELAEDAKAYLAALQTLKTQAPYTEAYEDAEVEVQTQATVLCIHARGLMDAMDQYTDSLPDDEASAVAAPSKSKRKSA